MKIAINTLQYRSSGGGITYMKSILPRLGRTNHEYLVFVPSRRNILTETSEKNIEFKEVGLPMDCLVVQIFYEQVVIPFIIWREDIDLLYSPVDIAPILAPCSIVLTIHNPNPYFISSFHSKLLKIKFRLQRYLTKLSSVRSDRIIFVSHFSKDVCSTILNIPERKCVTIHHGIECGSLHHGEEDTSLSSFLIDLSPYILTVSTVHRHKNYHTLLKGYAKLSEEIKKTHPLVIIGRIADKEYFEELNTICHKMGIEENTHFLGEVPFGNLKSAYENCGVYVLPSKLETFGMTLLEAMSYQLPVVASNATAIPEIAGDAARYFNPDDPEALAYELARVLEDDEVATQLIKNGYDRVDHFSWDRNVQQLVETFEEAYEENR